MNVTRFDQICQAWVSHFPALAGYVRVVTDSQATAKLSDRTGIQLVAVLPSYGRTGNAVTPRRTQTALFWIVEKALPDPSDTEELSQQQRTQDLVRALEAKIMDEQENGCSDWNRLEIDSIDINPEQNIFGGWNGWYLTFQF